jgi:hypothetical protein
MEAFVLGVNTLEVPVRRIIIKNGERLHQIRMTVPLRPNSCHFSATASRQTYPNPSSLAAGRRGGHHEAAKRE